MRLGEYIEKINNSGLDVSFAVPGETEGKLSDAALNLEISGISFDSRAVEPGTLFICKGAGFKQEFLDDAIAKGASAWVAGPDIRRAMAVLANMFYGDPWKDLDLVGITGTKGKTTTLYYLKSIMEASKVCGPDRFGFLSTIDTYDGVSYFESRLTTPEAIELGQRLANMRSSGIKAACMEVSSQALKYDRTYGVRFKYGVFTNFGSDHIGNLEHPDLSDYLSSKLKIFEQSDTAVLGMENERFSEAFEAAQACEKIICYNAENARREGGGTLFDIKIYEVDTLPCVRAATENGDCCENASILERAFRLLCELNDVRLTMPGLFNAHNAAAAACIALQLGASEDEIRSGLLDAKVPGRMEIFENKEKQLIAITDYAHNGLSFEKALGSAREEYPGYKIIAVFGCTGSKGLTRRVDLPRVAAKYADFSWITEDDPGYEDPMDIAKEALANLEDAGGKGDIFIDRAEIIKKCLVESPPKTVVLILGKGRDEYQIRNGVHVPYESDAVLAEKYINQK